MRQHTDRRAFIQGIGVVGITAGLAGCTGLLGSSSRAVDMEYGETVEGTITEGGPQDPEYDDLCATHAFEGDAGDTVEITMTSDELDPYLILTGPDGTDVVAEDDDGASGFNSQILADLPGDGVYTIWAGSYRGTTTGSYTLSLSQA